MKNHGKKMVDAALLRQVIDLVPHYIFAKNANGVYVLANKTVAQAYGTTIDNLEGKTDADFAKSAEEVAGFRRDDNEVLRSGMPKIIEEIITDGNYDQHLLQTIKIPFSFPDKDSPCVLGLCMDITERRRAEKQIEFLAHHDPLTGLVNRTQLKVALSSLIESNKQFAVLFLDLDHFKRINDSLGHGVGDEYLKGIATRLTGKLDKTDTVCRAGGDEFVIVLPEADAEKARQVATCLLAATSDSIASAGIALTGSCSIGIALHPEHGNSCDLLMRHADSALYVAKDAGRNTFAFFTKELEQISTRKLALYNGLKVALKSNDELELHYQPIVDAATGRWVAFEGLLRWTSATLGTVSPAEFIPLAEDTGIIESIGDLVIARAFSSQEELLKDLEIYIAINISARQLVTLNFEQKLRNLCDTHGGCLNRIVLELTESVFLADADHAIRVLTSLSKSGVRIAIDDFGTGYSSLSYLRKLPIFALKIDRSFVTECTTNVDDATIIRTILAMAKSLRLHVIAEGVETEEQATFLKEEGCQCLQGYLFSKALPCRRIAQLLRENI